MEIIIGLISFALLIWFIYSLNNIRYLNERQVFIQKATIKLLAICLTNDNNKEEINKIITDMQDKLN